MLTVHSLNPEPRIRAWGLPAHVAARQGVSRPGAGARCVQIYLPDSL